jgi:hypothetical protein
MAPEPEAVPPVDKVTVLSPEVLTTEPVPVRDSTYQRGFISYPKSLLKKIFGSETRGRPNESTRLEGLVIVHGGLMGITFLLFSLVQIVHCYV